MSNPIIEKSDLVPRAPPYVTFRREEYKLGDSKWIIIKKTLQGLERLQRGSF